MKDFALPGARAAFVGPDGLPQRPFYQWMLAIDRNVTENTNGNSNADASIKAIALKLGSPDGTVANIPEQGTPGTINGSGSIQVDGTLESGVVNLSLMYDTLFPGPSTFYGAGPDSKRGWFPVSGALADSVTIAVSTDEATGVSSFDLIGFGSLTTDDLSEGSANLYFTDERAREAVPMVYNRIDTAGDIRVDADGNLRITN